MDFGIRSAIKQLELYKPGKPIEELKREIPSLRHKKIIKLASNENPVGPSPKALAALHRALGDIHRYPESASPLLRQKLAERHEIGADQIIAGSGADELLRMVCETLLDAGDRVVVSQFAFSRFRQNAKIMDARVSEIPMKNYTHDLRAMAEEALRQKAKIIFIANPNNPTGTFNTQKELREFFRLLGPEGPWVVLDEAYSDFARDAFPDLYPETLPDFLRVYAKLIIARTFSKIVGLAGLRAAYAVASAGLIKAMNRARLIFNVNSLAQIAAGAALEDFRHIQRTLKAVKEGREFLIRELKDFGFEVVEPNAANFLFARAPRLSGKELFARLLREGIIIRPLEEPGLKNHVRISIGTFAENKALISALKKILN